MGDSVGSRRIKSADLSWLQKWHLKDRLLCNANKGCCRWNHWRRHGRAAQKSKLLNKGCDANCLSVGGSAEHHGVLRCNRVLCCLSELLHPVEALAGDLLVLNAKFFPAFTLLRLYVSALLLEKELTKKFLIFLFCFLEHGQHCFVQFIDELCLTPVWDVSFTCWHYDRTAKVIMFLLMKGLLHTLWRIK